MRTPSFRLHWQRQSQVDTHSAHSFLISLLRGLAALQVAAAHLRSEMFPGLRELADPPLYYQILAFATAFSHQAVVVFFLISGWLVGGSLLNKLDQPGAMTAYAIDRATRLWTVLVPALCLMLAVGAVTGTVSLAQADFSAANDYSAASFIGNLLGLQTVLVPTFADNYALWSLSNETWYYLQFPLLLIVFTGRTRVRQLVAATVLVLTAVGLPASMTVYFALWLLGALFSRVRIDCTTAVRAALLLAAAAALVFLRATEGNDDLNPGLFVKHLMYSLPLLAFLASMQRPLAASPGWMRTLAPAAHLLSEFSFTLYVIHVPLIKLLRHLGMQEFGRNRLVANQPADFAIYFGMLLAIMAAAYLSYLLFESHTFRIRRLLKNALRSQTRRPAIVSASIK
ncbi:acyltransferase [Herbaspirillum sp. SJZ107]|uniref:acyltransferase family protein n=1 Tax=Herbaspirillum sp. SJZ107 TaxID=2572881 RepID=UPI001639570B|nr:acyltransferase [Herbaspirillum sp. SJZ107]